jgi:multidrug efflux pump subunit AcrA (membrane-fusion protein)
MAAEGDLARLRIDRSGVTRRNSGGSSGLAFFLILLALIGGAFWLFQEPLMARIDSLRLPLVRVTRVSLSAPADAGAIAGLASNGYIVASRRAALSADTPGRIVELRVREGQVLEKDELVARLYDAEYSAAVQRCQADLSSAKAQIVRAEAARRAIDAEIEQLDAAVAAADAAIRVDQAELELAQREFARTEELVKKSAAIVTRPRPGADDPGCDSGAAHSNQGSTRGRAAGRRQQPRADRRLRG